MRRTRGTGGLYKRGNIWWAQLGEFRASTGSPDRTFAETFLNKLVKESREYQLRPEAGTIQRRRNSWFWLYYAPGSKKVSVRLGSAAEFPDKQAVVDAANARYRMGEGPQHHRDLVKLGQLVGPLPVSKPGACPHNVLQRNSCGRCNGASIYKRHVRQAASRSYVNELTEARYRWLAQLPCVYCGMPAGGVDRVKNEWGYTVMNSVPCCPTCNAVKRGTPAPEFITVSTRHAAAFLDYTRSYEQFKTRWIVVRDGGPDNTWLASSSTVEHATESLKPAATSAISSAERTAPTVANNSTYLLAGPLGSPPANMERAVNEHPPDTTETAR